MSSSTDTFFNILFRVEATSYARYTLYRSIGHYLLSISTFTNLDLGLADVLLQRDHYGSISIATRQSLVAHVAQDVLDILYLGSGSLKLHVYEKFTRPLIRRVVVVLLREMI